MALTIAWDVILKRLVIKKNRTFCINFLLKIEYLKKNITSNCLRDKSNVIVEKKPMK